MKAEDRKQLLHTLQTRFEAHMQRHAGLAWADVLARLDANPAALNPRAKIAVGRDTVPVCRNAR